MFSTLFRLGACLGHLLRSGAFALILIIEIAIILGVSPALAASQINNQINYQARLMDASGYPVADGTYSIKFSLYDAASGGNTLWTAAGTLASPSSVSISVQNGLLTVLLGSSGQNSLDSVDWNRDDLYLGVTIDADSEMTPRKRLAAAPQAFNSRQLQGMYASSTAFGDAALFTLNQTSQTMATGTRSVLQIQSAGMSDANDFLLRAINSSSSAVFTINRQGSVTSTGLFAVTGSGTSTFASAVSSTYGEFSLGLTVGGNKVCLEDGTDCLADFYDSLATVTGRGASTTSTLTLLGGFIGASSTVTSTFTVLGGTNLQNATATNVTTTNLFASGTVSSTLLYVNGQTVCLADGTNCVAGFYDTLFSVTGRGAEATSTLQLYGGFLASSSTVTSTFTVVGDTSLQNFTFTNATGTNVTTTALSATSLSSTSGTITTLNFSNAWGTNLELVSVTATHVTTTNLFASGTVSSTALYVNGQLTCLADGTNCPIVADLNWTYDGASEFVRNATATTDIVFGNSATATASGGASAYFDLSGGTNGTSTIYFGYATNVNMYIGATDTSALTGYVADGNDLFVSDDVGVGGMLYAGTVTTTNLAGMYATSSYLYISGYTTTTQLFANTGVFGSLVASGTTVCLTDGTGCAAGFYDTLFSVTGRGAEATSTLQLYGGFLASSSTVTSTFTVLGDTSLQNVSTTHVTSTRGFTALLTDSRVTDSSIAISELINPQKFDVQGNVLVIPQSSSNNISIVDVSDPSNVNTSTVTLTNNQGLFARLSGNYAYVVTQGAGTQDFVIIDLQANNGPAIASSLSLVGALADFYVSGRYAYIASTDQNSLTIVDISEPDAPWVVRTLGGFTGPWSVDVEGRYAYVTNYLGTTLSIVDVSNPETASIVGTYNGLSSPYYVDVQGRYAYVTQYGADALSIIDISDPSTPVGVATATGMIGPVGVEVSGRYAYVVAQGESKVYVVDTFNPTNPQIQFSISSGGTPVFAKPHGRSLYVSSVGADTITAYDLNAVETSALVAHNAQVGALDVLGNADVVNRLSVGGGLNVGAGGILSQGSLSVNGSTSSFMGGLTVGSSTYSGAPLHSLFSMSGDDLFVAGNIGSASSVYSNGAFVVGTGSTYYGDGYINKTNGNLTLQTSGGFILPNSDLGQTLGSDALRFNAVFGDTTSTNATTTNLYVSGVASSTQLFANSGVFGSLVASGTTVCLTDGTGCATGADLNWTYDGLSEFAHNATATTDIVLGNNTTGTAAGGASVYFDLSGGTVGTSTLYFGYATNVNMYIGATDTSALTGYVADGNDLFVSDDVGVGGTLYANNLSVIGTGTSTFLGPVSSTGPFRTDFRGTASNPVFKGGNKNGGMYFDTNDAPVMVHSGTAEMTVQSLYVEFSDDIISDADNTGSVGTKTRRWGTGYINNFYSSGTIQGPGALLTNVTSSYIDISGYTTTSELFANSGVFGSLVASGTTVCLTDGTNCADTLATVTDRGASATSTLNLYGGFIASSSTVTSTLTITAAVPSPVTFGDGLLFNSVGTQRGMKMSRIDAGTQFSALSFSDNPNDALNVSGTLMMYDHDLNYFSIKMYGDDNAGGNTEKAALQLYNMDRTGLEAKAAARIANNSVASSTAILSLENDGNYAVLHAGQNTPQGSVYGSTASIFFSTNGTAQGTQAYLNTTGGVNAWQGIATTDMFSALQSNFLSATDLTYSLGSASFRWNAYLGDTTSTNATTTNLYVSGTASSTQLFANSGVFGSLVASGTTVCLTDGTGCATGADLNWTYDGLSEFAHNATATTDIVLGNNTTGTEAGGASAYFDLSGGTNGTSTIYFGYATNVNMYIGATDTSALTGYVADGNDLFVSDDVGVGGTLYANNLSVIGTGTSTFTGNITAGSVSSTQVNVDSLWFNNTGSIRWERGASSARIGQGSTWWITVNAGTGAMTLQNAVFNTNISPTTDGGVSLGTATLRWKNGWFSGTVTSTGIETTNATSSYLAVSGYTTTSQLFANSGVFGSLVASGTLVCLSDGTNCQAAAGGTDLNWTYDGLSEFAHNATATTDIVLGNNTTGTEAGGASAYFDLSGGTNGTSTIYFGYATNVNMYIGATNTSALTGYVADGNDLFVSDDLGVGGTLYGASAVIIGTVTSTNLETTGAIRIANGSPTAPAIHLAGDLDTGLYSSGIGNFSITTAGVQRFRCGTTDCQIVNRFTPTTNATVDIGMNTLQFRNAWFSGTVTSTSLGVTYATSTYINSIIAENRTVTSTGNMNTNGQPLQIIVRGNLAYVLDNGGTTITVYDIADTRAPSSTETLTWAAGGVAQFDIAGEFVFGANTTTGQIQRIDLRYPNLTANVVATQSGITGVKVDGRYVYAKGSNPSLIIYEIHPILNTLSRLGTLDGVSGSSDIDIQGGNAYLTHGINSLWTVDVSDPAYPEDSTYLEGMPAEIEVQGGYLYAVNDYDTRFKIYDISNTSSQYLVTSLDLGATTTNLFVSGNYAYTATSTGRIFVVDIKNPSSPTKYTLTTTAATEAFSDIYVEGHHLYAIDSVTNKFYIYDLGGLEVGGLNVGTARIGALDVSNEALFQQRVDMASGLSIAGGLSVMGGLNVVSDSASSTARFFNSSGNTMGTNWSVLAGSIGVGSVNVTGTNNYAMAISYNTNTNMGLCIDDSATAATCPIDGFGGASLLADGSIVSNAFDIAEMYAVSGPAADGELLVLDSAVSSTVKVSSGIAYDPKLVGVVSTDPGFLLGWSGGTKVALAGRVPTKVSAANGPIRVGDPITSSQFVGYGMKATKPGMIVGYALEDAEATSTIEIYVNPGYYAGMILKTDGSLALLNDSLTVQATSTASSTNLTADSWGLTFRGSAWNSPSSTIMDYGFTLKNDIVNATSSRFVIENTNGSTTVSVSQEGDLSISGRLYPSARGRMQSQWYVFVDDSWSPTSTYIATNADGWQTLSSYDLAEQYYSPDKLEAGDLVMVGASGRLHVQRTLDDSSRVMGIVSTKPGFLLGKHATSSYPIALAGRVPTKISTVNGEIKSGDLLAPSSIPGVAVKATKTGPTIGVALEDYTYSAIGKIEVFVQSSWFTAANDLAGDAAAPTVQVSAEQQTAMGEEVTFRGTALIKAGNTRVHITFPSSLNAFPMVQVTPRGFPVGGWGTDRYSDLGFDIVLAEIQTNDIYFTWEARALDVATIQNSDGTISQIDVMTGQLISDTTTTTESEPEPVLVVEPEPQPVAATTTEPEPTSAIEDTTEPIPITAEPDPQVTTSTPESIVTEVPTEPVTTTSPTPSPEGTTDPGPEGQLSSPPPGG